ncbi:MAG TPA: hypothetical protein VH539_10390 [Gemmatimonadaceae bacterium]|jgi:hypothetical protein
MNPPELRAVVVGAGEHCVYCDRVSEAGERWIGDAAAWRYCSPTCYARVVEQVPPTGCPCLPCQTEAQHGRVRFNDALTAGHKALYETDPFQPSAEGLTNAETRLR